MVSHLSSWFTRGASHGHRGAGSAVVAGLIGPDSGSIGLARFFCFFQKINQGGHPNVPTSVNRLTVIGTGDRREES